MKTNTRVRRDSSKKTAVRKVRNSTETSPSNNGHSHSQANDPAAADHEPSILIFMKDGLGNGGVDYSAEEMADIERVAKYRGQTVSEFLMAAVDASIKNLNLIQKLDDGINMSFALYDLMEHRVFFPGEGDPSEDCKCGIVALSSAAFGKLQQARDALDCAITVKGGAR